MGQGVSAQESQAATGVDGLAAAHARLLREHDLQFDFPVEVEARTPPWVEALIEAIRAAGPVLKVLFWAGVAAIILFVVVLVVRDLMQVGRRWKGPDLPPAPRWQADVAQALILLETADRLAAEGRFEAAAHLLLLRGVQDLQSRRPRAIRPALTSREIAASPDLPAEARAAFGTIAAVVERSLYGGSAVDDAAWLACRKAYEDMIFPKAWAA